MLAAKGHALARLAVAGLLLAAMVPSPVQAEGLVLTYNFPSTGSITSVDLLNNSGDVVRFGFNPQAYNATRNASLQAAFVVLSRFDQRIDVTLEQAGALWQADLPVDWRALTTGTWGVTLSAITTSGIQSVVESNRSLLVQANDTRAPTIGFIGEQDGRVVLGPSDVLAVDVRDQLLGEVTYSLPTVLGELPLHAPHVLARDTFVEGPQVLLVRAKDRAGSETSRTVTVDVDTQPPQLRAKLPNLYAHVPVGLALNVTDASAYTLSLNVAGVLSTQAGPGPHAINFTPTQEGPLRIQVVARDAVGNVANLILDGNVSIPTTDSTLSLPQILPEKPVVGEALTLRVNLEQKTGVLPLNLTLHYRGAAAGTHVALVQGPGSSIVNVPLRLGVGQHTLALEVEAPANVVEVNATNQNATVDVEVFFGRVTHDGITYHIRADDIGFPAFAVGPNNTARALRAVDSGPATVYEFTALGNKTVRWDPLQPVSTTSSTSSSTPTEEEKAPAPGVALLVLLLALAVARRRR